MKNVIDDIPQHSLRFDSSCNAKFLENFEQVLSKQVIEMFSETCFAFYLKMSKCNYIGKIIKGLFMLEVNQNNPCELHACVKRNILRFSIFEFSLLTDLNGTKNIKAFKYF